MSNLSPFGSGRQPRDRAAARRADVPLQAVPRLIDTGGDEPWLARGLALFSDARFVEARSWADAAPPAQEPLGELLRTDVRMRLLEAQVPELVALRARVDAREPEGSALRGWVSAMIAERLAVEGEVEAIRVAVEAIDALDTGPLAPVLATYTRSRLLNVLSLGQVLASTGTADGGQRLHDEAMTLLLRCGFAREMAVARAVRAGATALVCGEDPYGGVAVLSHVRSGFPGDRSLWALTIDNLLGALGLVLGDPAVSEPAFARVEASSGPERLVRLPEYGRAALALLEGGPSPAAEARLVEAVDLLQTDPRQHDLAQGHAAHLLFDLDSPAAATLIASAFLLPARNPIDAVERRLLLDRRDIAAGQPPAPDELLGRLRALDGAGRVRLAATHALRLALTFARTGDAARAAELRQWGATRLPGPHERTPNERWLLAGDTAAAPAPTADPEPGVPVLEIEVLGSEPRVRVGGEQIALRRSESLLVLTLALAHPAPLHVEVINEALWPGQPADRSRINTVVHRLRSALGPAGALVQRRTDMVALDAARCRTDLEHYRAARHGTPPEQVRALAGVRGNLCEAAFPYEQHLLDERRRFLADWTSRSRQLVALGVVEPDELEPALRGLGCEPHALH